MNQIFPLTYNSRTKTPFIRNNFYSTNKNMPRFNSTSSIFSTIDGNKEFNLTSYYKELFLNQVNIKLDERVYDLISKMDDIKQYNEAKEQYDEAKRLLILEVMNDKYNDYLKRNKNAKRVNLKNYIDKINEKYSFDEKENQLMISLFNKLKTRKRKVFKFKIKSHLEKLYEGNIALYQKRQKNFFEEKKKPKKKFDMKLLIKSNSDIEEYIKKNKKKVMFDENSNKNNNDDNNINKNEFKRVEKKKRTFLDKKTKIKDFFANLNLEDDRRKSFIAPIKGFNTSNTLNLQKESNKNTIEDNSLLNLPNINEKLQLNNSNSKYNSSLKKDTKYKERKSNKSVKIMASKSSLNLKDNKDGINPINISDNKSIKEDKEKTDKKSEKSIKSNKVEENFKSNKSKINAENFKSIKINKNEENITSKSNLNLLENDIKNNKINLNSKKFNIKHRNNKKNKNNKNQKKTYISDTANEILSDLKNKEEKLSNITTKLNKKLFNFKNISENFNTIHANKTGNFNFKYINNSSKDSKILNTNNILNPTKKIGLMFKQVNENNSQFHFPIINKLFYKDKKGKIDMIDRIKNNLKHEYSEKLKNKRVYKNKEMIGHEILNKLNDQYYLEKLLEMADTIRERRRKEANYEI